MEVVTLILTIITYVAGYFVYKKMGREGWESLIPIYRTYVLYKELYGDGWRFLLLLIPFYNLYLIFKFNTDLAHAFNKSTGFGIGLIFLNGIFWCILGFSADIQYGDGSNTVTLNSELGDKFGRKSDDVKDADALLKYKELLDAGVISQEEFEAKKNEILNK